MLLLSERQAGEAWETSNKETLSQKWGTLERKVVSLFFLRLEEDTHPYHFNSVLVCR
jgi:hypothetical protein